MNKQGDGTGLIATSPHLKTERRGEKSNHSCLGVRGCRGKETRKALSKHPESNSLSFQISETEGRWKSDGYFQMLFLFNLLSSRSHN